MSFVIALDGPAASGKGTLGRALAAELGLDYLDTGLIYRGVARLALDQGLDPSSEACTPLARALAPADLARDDLRTEEVGQAASRVSAIPGVRAALLEFQQHFAANPPNGVGAILDGRDIGTVVCPGADVKLWLVADPLVRARRRHAENLAKGEPSDLDAIAASIAERDHREATRATAPMRPADDAVAIDTSRLTRGEVLDMAMAAVIPRLRARRR